MLEKLPAPTGAIVMTKHKDDETRYEIKGSTKGAIKAAGAGIMIGRFFGPVGMAVGAGVFGVVGYVLGEED